MSKLVLVTRVPNEGVPFKSAINVANIIEVSPKGDNESWLKYWDGEKIRSSVIVESPETIIKRINNV